LQKQTKDWQQEVHQPVVLGNNLTTGIMITYDFLRPDNLRLLAILQKQMKDWQQEVHQPVVLGNNLTTGIMITYDFLRPDN
ncbi:hypothetical protein HZD82_24615, partial [Pantoea agglomerans]|nr:hypothetical protein [Pantoea agglomerans]